MNKMLIVLLAVCLVSTHAFVKRDAPPATDLAKQLQDLQAQFLDLTKNLSDQTAAALNPEVIKKNLEDALEAAKQALDKLKPAAAGEAKPAA
ncbi:hypothetical protein PYW08_015829 [Mythimna loreyi]|uniref:Uncharacterized protein n=1 Tax=Mythimna loreyi TaxID=667449 RepID=A0ACC2QRX0_9NEOP|nr:hypothetical protein PYW08_015829 [Mythimna loreyi]